MGLDIVELHMAIEDHFGIRLPVNEIFPQTVGDVFDTIQIQLARAATRLEDGACACIPAFFEVRDVLYLLGAKAQRIRPGTRLDQVLPRRSISAAWETLETTLRIQLPTLAPPKESGAVFLAWLGSVVLVELLCFLAFDVAGLRLATVLIVPLVTWLSLWLHEKLPRPLPTGIATVRDLVHITMPPATTKQNSVAEGPLWDRLVTIVSDQLDVPRELIRPESHFVRDLRCD